jgi:hypothetical protein
MSGTQAAPAAPAAATTEEPERFRFPADQGIQAEDRHRARCGRGRGADAGGAGAVEHALISERCAAQIEAMIAAIDAKLTEQVNLIMHNEDFQQLESRGAACTTSSTTPRPTRH